MANTESRQAALRTHNQARAVTIDASLGAFLHLLVRADLRLKATQHYVAKQAGRHVSKAKTDARCAGLRTESWGEKSVSRFLDCSALGQGGGGAAVWIWNYIAKFISHTHNWYKGSLCFHMEE